MEYKKLTVSFKDIMSLFSCGRQTAEFIARESGAEIRIGGKRLYSFARLEEYRDRLIDEQEKSKQ